MADNFKLQTVLNHRQRLENLAQQKLAESLRSETAMQHQVASQRATLNKMHQELTQRQQTGISVQDLQLFRLSINRHRKNLQKLIEQAEELHREVKNNRQLLSEAAQEKKLLENLKEKKEAEQKHQDNRRESAILDDIALRLGKHSL
ncbi:flagellar export protein FliJ [Syntrophotalea acetylenivorans]|uniref:Flagellar FliJ protein n=1 Tax=Syntrophotalea acetylenivorans TaxID=1842532 RepID=A0A1L3GN05_9BACT|nr:flagellar export protein FliJ [Syntrophotalea acetylenivorans]APG27319.1 flagellar export protein FliJ [Syntrophotalea acetylenivorans]